MFQSLLCFFHDLLPDLSQRLRFLLDYSYAELGLTETEDPLDLCVEVRQGLRDKVLRQGPSPR